jgi:hypothetical protein
LICARAPIVANALPLMLPIAKTGTDAANRIPAFRGSERDREMAIANRTAPVKNSASPTPTVTFTGVPYRG